MAAKQDKGQPIIVMSGNVFSIIKQIKQLCADLEACN